MPLSTHNSSKTAKQGFDVKAIDMDGDDFTDPILLLNLAMVAAVKLKMWAVTCLATARARAAQYEEDRVSGQAAKDLYSPDENPAQGFLIVTNETWWVPLRTVTTVLVMTTPLLRLLTI